MFSGFKHIRNYIIASIWLSLLYCQVRSLQKYKSEEDIKVRYSRAFEDVYHRRFNIDAKNLIVDLHNFYRSKVSPPAGDMKLLLWDEELEHLAQIWADKCTLGSGFPRSFYSKGTYGQIMYIGTDPTGYNATRMWFETGYQYDWKTKSCKQVGRCPYKIVAWAQSSRIGCGVSKCDTRYEIVCNYFESASHGHDIYTIGVPCSQCTGETKTLCWNNLCVSQDQCEMNRTFCEQEASCNLECHNCGRINQISCQCACPDGYDTRDCSRPCQNEHERCGHSPGFPTNSSCSLNSNQVRDVYCRQMCGQCNAVSEESVNICCEGKVCEKGYVLNTDTCQCKKLCPGPVCDKYEGEEEMSTAEVDLLRQKELQLKEKEEFLKSKEMNLEKKEKFLKQKELYLEEKELMLKKQEQLLLSTSI